MGLSLSQMRCCLFQCYCHILQEKLMCLEGSEMFKPMFEMTKPKAGVMTYSDGQKKTLTLRKRAKSAQLTHTLLSS